MRSAARKPCSREGRKAPPDESFQTTPFVPDTKIRVNTRFR
jgi:hypothetical protein